ncbi:hypothetical protein FBU30_001809 [Linnemannia zychae]|nr:hypothetical protein FBU30_001809 [Linnemannia zychae]
MSCSTRNNKAPWRKDIENLTSRGYFELCQRPQEFSYQGFLLWSKSHLIGKAKVRREWSEARKQFHNSHYQILRETAVRLDKMWESGVDEVFEATFFKEQHAMRQLMDGRLTVHTAADNVIVKRQRIELEGEEQSLDEELQSGHHSDCLDGFSAKGDSSANDLDGHLLEGQITPPNNVVPLVKDLSHEDQVLYNSASEWFRTNVGQDLETTIQNVRKNQFQEHWVHDLLYDRLKLLRTGLGPQCDENTYTSFWIVPDFVALQTGIPGLISIGFANENHFGPSAWRRALSRGKPYVKGTNVDAYYLGRDDFVDIIFENVGSPSCTDHAKHIEDKEKSYRNAADALLERFYNSTGSFEIAKGYCVIIVIAANYF